MGPAMAKENKEARTKEDFMMKIYINNDRSEE